MSKISAFAKHIGPGLLFASMAIGTSHLVLSTKAGAQYGWIMVVPILLANILKYPFFEFGVRYTSVTNKTLIEGYLNQGKAYLWFYAIITLFTTFTILAALYTVTAGLFLNMFPLQGLTLLKTVVGLFLFISALLILGKYKFLELSLKFIISLLFIALLVTTILVIIKGKVANNSDFIAPSFLNEVGVLFIIGLMGWMPTTVEASSWVSLWTVEKYKTSKDKPSLKEALTEFNVGYVMTAVLAVFFLIIGWMTVYGSATILSDSAVVFADQLVQLFTDSIGSWAYIIIAIAAFSTMFSTCLTAHDAVSRVCVDIAQLLSPKIKASFKKHLFSFTVVALAVINLVVILVFEGNMGTLVALATFISFVVAPIIGYLNYKIVMSSELPDAYKPKKTLRILTFMGILFLSLFSVYYFWMVLF